MKAKIKKYGDQRSATIAVSLISIVILIGVTKIMKLIVPAIDAEADASTINKVFMACLAICLPFVLKTRMTVNLSALKIGDKKTFGRGMLISGLISVFLIAAMIVIRLILNRIEPGAAERPVFGLYPNINGRWFYPISSVLQEFAIKAFMQENFRSLSPNGNKHFTVMINGIFFAALHMNYPLFYMAGACLLCILTGYMYEKDRNIWGASLIHFVIGFMPRALGLT